MPLFAMFGEKESCAVTYLMEKNNKYMLCSIAMHVHRCPCVQLNQEEYAYYPVEVRLQKMQGLTSIFLSRC
uniref:Uncharacterized protein n=1 Tax=Arundo donax TaxID=35708 RepID=A0A0A8ZLI6_ARUDO